MATGIPLPGMPGDSFLRGINSGSGMFSRMIQPALEREKLRQQGEQFKQQLELHKQNAARAGALDPLRKMLMEQQILGLQHKNDPNYEMQQLQNLMNFASGGQAGGGQMNAPQPQAMPQEEQTPFGQGQGMMNPEAMGDQAPPMEANQDQMQPSSANPAQQGGMNFDALKNNPLVRGYFKHHYGIDLGAESPEAKRAADLQSKIELENIKTANKTKGLEQKEVLAVKKDLPTLEKSLKGVDELLQIAKTNPDLFGHGFMPDRFAKTTKNKNFGRWQNLISDAIAGLEQKLSSKGNIVALKMAAQLKPSHGEQQQVAIGKLESMQEQLKDAINRSRVKSGQKVNEVANGNMDMSQMSDEELQRIASGGQ